jgi:hypothetical protein
MGKFKTRAFEGEYEVNSIKTMHEGMYPKDELKFVFVIVNNENPVSGSTKIIIIKL